MTSKQAQVSFLWTVVDDLSSVREQYSNSYEASRRVSKIIFRLMRNIDDLENNRNEGIKKNVYLRTPYVQKMKSKVK